MTDPTPQTTPTRDEAVRELELIRRLVIPMVRERSREPGDAWDQAERVLSALASAPAPASGGVDAVAVLSTLNRMVTDYLAPGTYKARFPKENCPWHSDFPMPDKHHSEAGAHQVNLRRDQAFIRDVVHLQDNPSGIKPREPAYLSPAATPVSEAGGEPDMRRVCEALGFDPTNHHNAAKCPYCNPDQADAPKLTYRSTQATTCASCGEHKHTPLRRDEMGGYVCLTCIDKRLAALAKPASSPAGGDEIARWKRDSELLSAIQDECWDVRFTNSPNADAGDYNVNIEIVGHFMADPQERVVGENYNENLRAALEQAMTAEPYPPARPIYEEPDEPEDAAILAAIDTGQKESQP